MSNNKNKSAIAWYVEQCEKLKDDIFYSIVTADEFRDKKLAIEKQATDMFYNAVFEAFEEGRVSGYDEAIAEVVKGETFFGLKDGEDFIKENYG